MNVKELIEQLSKCDHNSVVSVVDSDDRNSFRILDVSEEYGAVYIKAAFSVGCGY